MAFALSPGVSVVEKDFSAIVPAVSTSAGAFAGNFAWGPVLEPTTITSENNLVARFGRPNDSNFESFFTASNFLSYANNLLTVRIDGDEYKNAVSSGTAIKIKNSEEYITQYSNGQATVGEFAAKYPGTLGNSLLVSMADSASYDSWAYKDSFNGKPSTSVYANAMKGNLVNDELHVIVIDQLGLFTGTPGATLEKFAFVSKASDSKLSDGTNNYYKDVINSDSKYIWWMDHPDGMVDWGTTVVNATGGSYDTLSSAITRQLSGGTDDVNSSDYVSRQMEGFNLFVNSDLYDISLVIAGKASTVTATSIINNLVEVRKDCVAFISPQDTTGTAIVGSDSTAISKLIAYRDALPSTSYAVIDSGFKYQYDRFNDKYRYVPLNGDIAGLCARTDYTDDPWFSPGGFTRGQVKNVIKLAVNPNKTQRDQLYVKGINPVVSFPGQGTVLYGDKTMLAKPSAFDRINVRRLFIVLEKAIATAAKFQLFEFNDPFTRAQFKNLVEPFLRDVQGRRGIIDFRVVSDETNNTGEVIDNNQFVADIYIKPARSINFIQLSFVAARTSVSFNEIGA